MTYTQRPWLALRPALSQRVAAGRSVRVRVRAPGTHIRRDSKSHPEGVAGVEHTQLPWVARGPAISLPVRAERSVRVRVRGPPSPRRSAQLMHWPPLYRLTVERDVGALRGHVYDLSGVPPIDPHPPPLDVAAHDRSRQPGGLGHQLDQLGSRLVGRRARRRKQAR